MAHPTWVEMQKVMDGVSGMKTASIRRESASSKANLRVPSTERSSATIFGVDRAQSVLIVSRSARERSVIRSMSVTPRLYIQLKS